MRQLRSCTVGRSPAARSQAEIPKLAGGLFGLRLGRVNSAISLQVFLISSFLKS